MAVKFEKELFNGYRIHAYEATEIVLAIPQKAQANSPDDDAIPGQGNFYHATQSFIVAPGKLIKDWPVPEIRSLTTEHLQTILDLEPELVLLGTGKKQQFPQMQLMTRFYDRGIGVEVMDSAAACRTFNILAGESRKVVAGIVID